MPLYRALVRLWQTPRVYRDQTTLIDPKTGETARTIGPRSTLLVPALTPALTPAPTLVPLFEETPDWIETPRTKDPDSRPWDILAGGGPLPSTRISSIPPPPAA
jgi:hypothetical protein